MRKAITYLLGRSDINNGNIESNEKNIKKMNRNLAKISSHRLV